MYESLEEKLRQARMKLSNLDDDYTSYLRKDFQYAHIEVLVETKIAQLKEEIAELEEEIEERDSIHISYRLLDVDLDELQRVYDRIGKIIGEDNQ